MWTDTISAWQHSPALAFLLCVYLKAKAAEPRPHLLASLVAMNAHIIPLSPCKPRAASCAKGSESLPLTKTSTRLRNSLCDNQFIHGNFAYSAQENSHPSVETHISCISSLVQHCTVLLSHTSPTILGRMAKTKRVSQFLYHSRCRLRSVCCICCLLDVTVDVL